MLPSKYIFKFRHLTLITLVLAFPTLYLGAVSLESLIVTVIGLVLAAIGSCLAMLSF